MKPTTLLAALLVSAASLHAGDRPDAVDALSPPKDIPKEIVKDARIFVFIDVSGYPHFERAGWNHANKLVQRIR